MSEQPSVVDFDGDEAVAEAIAGMEEARNTRGGLLARRRRCWPVLGVAAALCCPARRRARAAAARRSNDIKILNYALTLEYLEAAFYAEALRVGGYTGAVGRFARSSARHEATHVATLKGVLGSKAVKSPSFDFKGTTRKWSTFLRTAKVLEDTGVAAYQGQAPLIHQNAVLGAGGRDPRRRGAPRRVGARPALRRQVGQAGAGGVQHADVDVRRSSARSRRPASSSPDPGDHDHVHDTSPGSTCPRVVDFDADGALQETRRERPAPLAPRLPARVRRSPLGGAAVAGGAAARRARWPPRPRATSRSSTSRSRSSTSSRAFYASALKHAGLTGEHKRFARLVHAARGRARRGAEEGARLRGGQAADVRLRLRRHEPGRVHRDRDHARGHRRAGLPGPGAVHQVPGRLQGRDLDPPGRGAPRRLDPQPRRISRPAPAAFNPALTKNQVLAAVSAHRLHQVGGDQGMPNIGPMELIDRPGRSRSIVLGPKRLPEAGKSLGRGMREFKDTLCGASRDEDEPVAVPGDARARARLTRLVAVRERLRARLGGGPRGGARRGRRLPEDPPMLRLGLRISAAVAAPSFAGAPPTAAQAPPRGGRGDRQVEQRRPCHSPWHPAYPTSSKLDLNADGWSSVHVQTLTFQLRTRTSVTPCKDGDGRRSGSPRARQALKRPRCRGYSHC